MTLQGRTAIVTGGGSGIGRAIALRLAQDGAVVGILDFRRENAETVAGEIRSRQGKAVAVYADVASHAEMTESIAKVREALGPITVLVNNAGHGRTRFFTDMTEEEWDRMVAVHLKGCFNGTRAVLPDMIAAGWGRIVSISSVAGLGGGAGAVHYSAAKAGILGFTKALAQEVGRHGITVNAIAPGLVDTPILRGVPKTGGFYAKTVERSAVRRAGTPEDIAAACAYIVSTEASFLTGQTISPNGGIHF